MDGRVEQMRENEGRESKEERVMAGQVVDFRNKQIEVEEEHDQIQDDVKKQ